MAQAVALYSSMVMPDEDLAQIMTRLRGETTEYGWRITRNDISIDIEPVHDEIPDAIPADKLQRVADELGARPQSKLVVLWSVDDPNGMPMRMARAVGKALSEQFTIVFDDNFGTIEEISPASIAGEG